jgi:hypothetical protein
MNDAQGSCASEWWEILRSAPLRGRGTALRTLWVPHASYGHRCQERERRAFDETRVYGVSERLRQ